MLKIGQLAQEAVEAVRAEAMEKLASAQARPEARTLAASVLRKLAEDLRSNDDDVSLDDLAKFVAWRG
jgi:hypothetical protein